MENNIIHSIHNGQQVACTYAETYLDDVYCDENTAEAPKLKTTVRGENQLKDEWSSPSDLLIGKIALKTPLTSKTTRGVTHKGILSIGNTILQKEQETFLEELKTMIQDNESAWSDILVQEKESITAKVKKTQQMIFEKKSKVMTSEIASFYESSLQELEDHIRTEVQNTLINVHARMISNLNVQVKNKLRKEKHALEKILRNRYITEDKKMRNYYKLLLQNEVHRNNILVHSAVSERNEALKVFFQQLEMENTTNTMYVMSTERKKCKIKKFIVENYQDTEIAEKLKKIKEREIIIDAYKKDDVRISDINKEWEEKIKKILQLFLKFTSFSLKLLPEQTTFLLDFQKMMVLQLNEIIQKPKNAASILVQTENIDNTFKFDHLEPQKPVCDTEPIVLTGNMEDPTPPQYGSRESLASDVELPMIRVQRQFIYAKCQKYEEVKKLLESQRCKCRDMPTKEPSQISLESESIKESVQASKSTTVSESSNEPFLVDDIDRLYDCPGRKCTDWSKRFSFPYLDSYLDFSEENYDRVQHVLGNRPSELLMPELLDPTTIISTQLPFAATTERCHTIATQYSSQDICAPVVECPCVDNISSKTPELSKPSQELGSKGLSTILMERRNAIKMLLQENSELLKMFTDESFDFIY